MNPLNLSGPDFLVFYGLVLVIAMLAVWGVRRWATGAGGGVAAGRRADLEPYELAYLASGPIRAVQAAVVALAGRGAVAVGDGGVLTATGRAAAATDPVEATALRALAGKPAKIDKVVAACRTAMRSIEDRLVGAGLLVPGGARTTATLASALLLLGVLGLGIAKAAVGAQRHKPIGFLILALIVAFIAMVVMMGNPVRLTAAGKAALAEWSSRHYALQRDPAARAGNDQLMLAVALFGPTLLAGTAMADLQRPLAPPASSGGGDSGGSSCGGSSCGGGGGCGGCGGGGD